MTSRRTSKPLQKSFLMRVSNGRKDAAIAGVGLAGGIYRLVAISKQDRIVLFLKRSGFLIVASLSRVPRHFSPPLSLPNIPTKKKVQGQR